MATILIPIAVLSFHLKYCILYFTNFNFSFFILFFLLNMLTPSSTFLNIWSIVIRAVLMSLSTNCITYVISGSVYWLIWFFSLWVVFSCFNLQAWLKKSTSKKKKCIPGIVNFTLLDAEFFCLFGCLAMGGMVSMKYFWVMFWDTVKVVGSSLILLRLAFKLE